MANATIATFPIGFLWPTAWGTSGILKIISDRPFVAGGQLFPKGSVSDPVNQNFCYQAAISVASNIATVAAITLPQTDVGITNVNGSGEPSFTGIVYSNAGRTKRNVLFQNWRIGESLTTSFSFSAWASYNDGITVVNPRPIFLDEDEVNNLITARLYAPATTSSLGLVEISAAPDDVLFPRAVGKNDYATLTNFGISRPSVAPASAAIPVFVGDNDNTRIAPRIGTRYVIANGYSGADVGAKINAADAALGSDVGEIWVFGGGNIATQVVISAGHTIVAKGGGTYTATTNGAVIRLKNGSGFKADSWASIFEESTGNTAVSSPFTIVCPYNGSSADSLNGAAASNITIEGVHFRGARSDFDSASATVALLNAQGAKVIGCWLESTRTIGINTGGGASLGNYGRDVLIAHNLLTDIAFAPIGVTNADDVTIDSNIIRRPHQAGSPISVCIDVEPNASSHAGPGKITNNICDCSDSAANLVNDGIALQNTVGIANFGPWTVSGNTIIGARHTQGVSNSIPDAGILVNNAADVHIHDNLIQRATRGIKLTGATSCEVVNNRLSSCGSGGTNALDIGDSTHNDIKDNILYDYTGDALGLGVAALTIVETGLSDYNNFAGNHGGVTIVGANSKKYLNYKTDQGRLEFGVPLYTTQQLVSTLVTGTAPLVVASTTNVANLNASSLSGATMAAPGAIGGGTPSTGAFTTISATGQVTSTLATGTAPLVVASTTKVANLNADQVDGADWAAPLALGSTTPAPITGTTVTANTSLVVNGGTALTKILKGTVTVDPASINATTFSSQTFTLTGAATGDVLILNPPTAGLTAGMFVLQCFVSAADTITICLYNSTGGAIDLASASWLYTLIRS